MINIFARLRVDCLTGSAGQLGKDIIEKPRKKNNLNSFNTPLFLFDLPNHKMTMSRLPLFRDSEIDSITDIPNKEKFLKTRGIKAPDVLYLHINPKVKILNLEQILSGKNVYGDYRKYVLFIDTIKYITKS